MMHELGCFVHGALAALHTLGVVYNLKRGNKWQAALHAGVACYDIWAVNEHRKELAAPILIGDYDVEHNFV